MAHGTPTAPQQPVHVVLRPLASPLPLGFVGLGGGTFALAGLQLGWVPSIQSHLVAAAILLVAVPLQGLASVLGFLARDPAVATAMGLLTGTWAMTGVLTLMSPPGARSPVIGLVLFYLAAALVVMAALAATGKGLAAVVLALASVRFAITGVYEYLGGSGWMRTAGWVGVVLGAVALVAFALFAFEDAGRRIVAPTLRRGAGRRALAGDGADTVGPVTREAGVRDQL